MLLGLHIELRTRNDWDLGLVLLQLAQDVLALILHNLRLLNRSLALLLLGHLYGLRVRMGQVGGDLL